MIRLLYALFGLGFICACAKNEEIPVKHPTDTDHPAAVAIADPEFVFGFIGENKYSYCPSVLSLDDGTVHLFFCGNPEDQVMVDNIYHIRINPDGSRTQPKSILQPGIAGAWDDHHTCDPSIIAGKFSFEGTDYRYAMFFLSNMYGVYYNEIGVAFSNDLDSENWIKYPTQVVRKTWIADGDQYYGNNYKSWGVGQPSAISLDGKGKVLLTYTIGDIGGTRIVWSEADFSDMATYTIGTPVPIAQRGLKTENNLDTDYLCNSDFAIDKEHNKILMIRPVQPHPTDYPAYLNRSLEIDSMDFSDFMNQTGSWTSMCRITPNETGYPRNHNAALLRDSFGHISNWDKPQFYFTVSKATPDVYPSNSGHAEWTYHIWKSWVK